MLLQFRKFSRGAIATIILGLVGLAMVLFLPNGQFSLSAGQDLAKVGQYAVTPMQLSREMEFTLRQQRREGANVTQQEAIDAGLHNRLLEGMIGRFSLYAYADKLGVSASDRQVGARIREFPGVLNPVSGQFDRTAYATFLADLGYGQPEFEREIRGDITNQMLLQSLITGVRPPSSYGALALAFESETRVVSIAEAPISVVGAVAPPTEAQLQAFYEESREILQIPEFRVLTLAVANPQEFAARVDVPDARVEEEVAARRDSMGTPERRTYIRIAAQNEQQANDVAARLTRGETPAAAAGALRLQMTRGENHTLADVSDPRVGEAVFAMGAGAPPRVVRGQLSPFVVVRVESIAAATSPDLNALRQQIRTQIAEEEAAEELNDAVGVYEDARAGGASVADAARQARLTVLTIPAVNAQGRDPDGRPVELFTGAEELLRAAFETPEGEASDFTPVQSSDVVVSVDRVIPATVRPLAEVSDDLRTAWINRERVRRLREVARTIATAVAGGTSFADAARANRMSVVIRSREISRQDTQQIPSRGLGTQIFGAAEGEVVNDLNIDSSGILVAVVEDIRRVDPATAPQVVEASRAQAQQALTASFAEGVQSEIIARMRPSRNTRLLESTFRRSDANAEQ